MFENFFIYINNIVLVLGAQYNGDSHVELVVKYLPASSRDIRDALCSLDWEDPWREGMAAHCSIFATKNPMDRGAWWVTVHRVTKSRTQLTQDLTHMHAHVQTSERGFVLLIFKKFI